MLLANNAMDDLAMNAAEFAAEIAAGIAAGEVMKKQVRSLSDWSHSLRATEPAADTEDIRKQLQDMGISMEAPWDGRKKHLPVEEKHCTALLAEVLFGVLAEEAQELWEKIQVLARTRS